MVEGPVGVPAAILGGQRGVVELHAAVDAGDHDALAAHAELVPHLGRVDAVDVPLGRLDLRDRLAGQRLGQLGDAGGLDALHLGQLRDLRGQLGAAGHLDGVRDPERGEVGALGGEERAQARLGRGGQLGLGPEDLLGLLGLGLRPAGRAEVGVALQADPEGGLVVRRQLREDGFVDLVRVGRGVGHSLG